MMIQINKQEIKVGLVLLFLALTLHVDGLQATDMELLATSETKPQSWRFTLDEPAKGWTGFDFDDGRWSQGNGPFGGGNPPGLSARTPWTTSEIWMRRSFVVRAIPENAALFLRLYHDEDIVVYLNGEKIAQRSGWTTKYIDIMLNKDVRQKLRLGKNVVALHCRQSTGGQGVDVGITAIKLTDFSITWKNRELSLADRDGGLGLCLRQDNQTLMVSPDEGLWSIGKGWSNNWPHEWQHGHATSVAKVNQNLVLSGQLIDDAGVWEVRDTYRLEDGRLRASRRWHRKGQTADQATLTIRWIAPGVGRGATMPAVMYHGNPAGQNSHQSGWKGVVPIYDGKLNSEAYFEEHRFAAPFVCFEWKDTQEQTNSFGFGVALHTLPSLTPYSANKDQWWSIGIAGKSNKTELAATSGLVSINGKRGEVKSGQNSTSQWGPSYLTVSNGATVEKNFGIECFNVAEQGAGFQTPLRSALEYFEPFSTDGLPRVADIVRAKYLFTRSRWSNPHPDRSGFAMYPNNPDLYVMGWAGQSEAPGYALIALADRLGDPENALQMSQQCLDTLCQAPFNAQGFLLALDGKTGKWSRQDPISQGQAMNSFACAIRVGRNKGLETKNWETFLRRACDIHSERILDRGWSPASTNEAFLVAPLCKAAQLFSVPIYEKAAIKAADYYANRHIVMHEPYWGGTLDARCEDKEGAWAGFQAFINVYELTGNRKYLRYAEHACDVVLTYTYLWNVSMPPGRLADHSLKTRGWSSVSVQNMHLDVYGVLYTPEIYRLGSYTDRAELKKLALVMYRACGQMIDEHGSQGEQLNHTNFVQGMPIRDVHQMRGTYNESWSVYWIAAHFLSAAAKFEEMGVDIWK